MTAMPVKSNSILLYADAIDPFAAKVYCWLNYKGLEFNTLYVDPLSRRQIAFTRQTRLPVLKIGDEWRTDTEQIGLWLEDCFPEKPMLGRTPAQRELILQMDQWVTHSLIAAGLRRWISHEHFFNRLRAGWRLGAVLHRGRSLALPLRAVWPIIMAIQLQGNELIMALDQTESLANRDKRVCQELLEWLGKGPFLGELPEPSLADLAAFPQLLAPYWLGLPWRPAFLDFPVLSDWLQRVQAVLPNNPLLASEDTITVQPLSL